MTDEFDGKLSSFNEAALKMLRIHESQAIMNRLRTNLLSWNYDYNKYNYEVFISEVLSILSESHGKLSEPEKEVASRWRTTLITLLEKLPIYETVEVISLGGAKSGKRKNDVNWGILRGAMFDCEDWAKQMLEIHNLSAPNIESEGGWD